MNKNIVILVLNVINSSINNNIVLNSNMHTLNESIYLEAAIWYSDVQKSVEKSEI